MKLLLPLFLISIIITGTIAHAPVSAHSTGVTITMTEEGFVPREVTVDASATITFINKDTVPHWPASNPHPSHSTYSQFDPAQPIAPGEWWIFNPTKPGTWHYHDHLNAHRQGTLIVTTEQDSETQASPSIAPSPVPIPISRPSFFTRFKTSLMTFVRSLTTRLRGTSIVSSSPAPTVLGTTTFLQLPEKEQYQYLETLAATRGPEEAWRFAKDTFATVSPATPSNRAHDSAHFIGDLIFAKYGIGGLSICDATFAFGCYHGVTAAAFADNLDLLPPLATACEKIGARLSGPWSSCIHGIGHGIASYFNSTDLASALATCDQLGDGATYCHDGVFMEFANSAPASFYDRTRPLHPCDTLPAIYQGACGRNIVPAMGRRFGLSPETVAAACLETHALFSSPCIDTVGFAIANQEGSNHQRLMERCAAIGQPAAAAQCTSAAAMELVFQDYPGWQTESAATCAALAPAYLADCLARVQQTINNYQRSR